MRSYKVIEVLFPGPRRPVMCAIFQEPQRWWLLSELAGRAGVTPASLRRHMMALRRAGLVREKTEERHCWFQADSDCPIFGELQSIVAKLTSRADGVETILVVEDQPATAQITRILLESWGYRVIETHGAREALDVFDRLGNAIQLLLTDVIMPGVDGPQLAAELRAPHARSAHRLHVRIRRRQDSARHRLPAQALQSRQPFPHHPQGTGPARAIMCGPDAPNMKTGPNINLFSGPQLAGLLPRFQ